MMGWGGVGVLVAVCVGGLSWLIMKSMTALSGWSVGGSGMLVKIRLSLMLRDYKSRMDSFMVLFSEVTEASRVLMDDSWADMVETER